METHWFTEPRLGHILDQPETPGRVIINEALELARTFSTDESVGFINGILDEIRRSSERE